MAVVHVDTSFDLGAKEKDPPPPPAIATTPCDPWPRPYYFEDGLRRVAPYHYTYNTYCKMRWRGREILDIFATEFRDRTKEYYRNAIETGNVVLNGKRVPSIHTIVKNGDVISHTLHRHEPPVTGSPIGIIHEDDDMIVIDKPAGVPVHPAGRYQFNSIIEIMRAERGMTFNPMPCNRLDRLTSGVMFIGKNPVAAEEIGLKIRERTVRKDYVARVKGRFPDGEVLCDQPILAISPLLGLNRARSSGKDARTRFRRIAYHAPKKTDGAQEATEPSEEDGYSIVHCVPLTGRTHQLRVHLQYLGHPITNDPIYCNRRVFGPDLARANSTGSDDGEIIARLSKMGKTETAEAIGYTDDVDPAAPAAAPNSQRPEPRVAMVAAATLDDADEKVILSEHEAIIKDYERKKGEKMSGEKCPVCNTDLYTDPSAQELGIYLHAVAYADFEGKWRYQSKMPAWALPPDEAAEKNGWPSELPAWNFSEGVKIVGDGTNREQQEDDDGKIRVLVEGMGVVSLDAAGRQETGAGNGDIGEPTTTPMNSGNPFMPKERRQTKKERAAARRELKKQVKKDKKKWAKEQLEKEQQQPQSHSDDDSGVEDTGSDVGIGAAGAAGA